MSRKAKSTKVKVAADSGRADEAAWPAWITTERIAETIAVWQPHSKEKLTEADAVEMLINVRRLAEVLRRACGPQPQAIQLQKAPCTRAA